MENDKDVEVTFDCIIWLWLLLKNIKVEDDNDEEEDQSNKTSKSVRCTNAKTIDW